MPTAAPIPQQDKSQTEPGQREPNHRIDHLIDQIKAARDYIAQHLFVDPDLEVINGKPVNHWKILLGLICAVGRKNMLLTGVKSTGKTTYASLLSSVVSGLPFDLYDIHKIQGHPEQAKDTMFVRVDLSNLAQEGVVWQPAMYLDFATFDELNRNLPGKVAIATEYIRTGIMEHLGKYLRRPKPGMFATLNFNGVGTYPIPPPVFDRFDISLEFMPGPSFLQPHILEASRTIKRTLIDEDLTDEITANLLDKSRSPQDKFTFLENTSARYRDAKPLIPFMPSIQSPDLQSVDVDLPFSPHAKTLVDCILDELNTTKLYGTNRGADLPDDSSHNQAFASAKANEGVAARFYESLVYFSSMLARITKDPGSSGDLEITVDHVMALAPYLLAHRLEFTPLFEGQYKKQQRLKGEREEMDLTRRLVNSIKANYDTIKEAVHILDYFLSLYPDRKEELKPAEWRMVRKILKGPPPDHPLLLTYYHESKRQLADPIIP